MDRVYYSHVLQAQGMRPFTQCRATGGRVTWEQCEQPGLWGAGCVESRGGCPQVHMGGKVGLIE